MGRHHISDERVDALVDRLVELFLRLGSVNALADVLSEAAGARIYPNRIHGLLSDDPSRSINTVTLETLERAAAAVTPDGGTDPDIERSRLRQAAAAYPTHGVDLSTALGDLADRLGVPPTVLRRVADFAVESSASSPAKETRGATPDWSWQDEAVRESLKALRRGVRYKAGLIVPTGGGKTRIALRVVLDWLKSDEREESVVLWVTHRRRLHKQARRALHKLLKEGVEPTESVRTFAERVKFVMLGDLTTAAGKYAEQISLVVVDEAHHAAAPSYEPLFSEVVAPALFLTATPNRADELPLGIDEIAYTITYRELFRRGCVIEPIFDPPLNMFGMEWQSVEGLRDLVDYLLDRSEDDFGKVLVAVSLQARAELLYEAISDVLDARTDHPLSNDDIGFVHGAKNSSGLADASDFLDEFSARPRGILIATSQLVGEGYDDPSIDAVVVTYPSSSITHLMQVAGRALRATPGKSTAHVVQVRESAMQYHFEQRWLYQDISDQLRPDLVDLNYVSRDDLRGKVEMMLKEHNVPGPTTARVLEELAQSESGEVVHLTLTGVPFFGAPSAFTEAAQWGALFIDRSERERFVRIFNDVSARTYEIKEHDAYLKEFVAPAPSAGSLWKSYVDLVTAMEYARREIQNVPYAGAETRGFDRGKNTTWIKYVTFTYAPAVPEELDRFLADAVNREEVILSYVAQSWRWLIAVKIELPAAGSKAFLLDDAQSLWVREQQANLTTDVREAPPGQGFAVLCSWRSSLDSVPVPLALIDHFDQLSRADRAQHQMLDLLQVGGVPQPEVSD